MIIYFVNLIMLLLAGVIWDRSDLINLFIKVVFFTTAIYNGFEAYRFYIMGA